MYNLCTTLRITFLLFFNCVVNFKNIYTLFVYCTRLLGNFLNKKLKISKTRYIKI